MAADVANATGGKVVGQNAHLDGVSFDSRTLRPGQLFVPIVAERDGHEFIDDAVARSIPVASELRTHEVNPIRGDGPELLLPASHGRL